MFPQPCRTQRDLTRSCRHGSGYLYRKAATCWRAAYPALTNIDSAFAPIEVSRPMILSPKSPRVAAAWVPQ